MRALVLAGVGSVRVEEVLDPVLRAGSDVLVRVSAAGLCGSDLHPYSGREPAAAGVVQGHEAVGEVVEVGADVQALRVGDRVAVTFTTSCGGCGPCRAGLSARCASSQLFGWGAPGGTDPLHGGQASMLRVPHADRTAVVLPPEVDDALGVLLCDNLPTGWYAAVRAGVVPGARVAVVGLGAVGLCAVVAARALGAAEVLVTDLEPDRVARAVRIGGTALAEGDQVDCAIEAAGPAAAQATAAALVRAGGTLSVISVQTGAALGVDPGLAYDRNLTLRFGRAPVRSVLDDLLPRVLSGEVAVPVSEIVTHRLPLADGADAYRRFAAREPGFVKALLLP